MRQISWLISALFIIAIPLFLVSSIVTWAFNDPGVYNDGFEKYSVSRTSGITDADLRQVGVEIRQYINSTDEPLDVKTRILGQEQNLFNKREIWYIYLAKDLEMKMENSLLVRLVVI